jgi:acetolactate synthase-1/2/3 large subunit
VNGAQALLATLSANDVTTCFANPGTSEMHFVASLDDAPHVNAILCLFEGVATGAADGFARVTSRPASTLLHLGPGLANGWANLHNARRAHSPVVNIVGDHATYHSQYDAPLQSDIGSIANALNGWHHRSLKANDVADDAARAVAAAYGPPGQVATLILPADVSWSDVDVPVSWPLASRAPAREVSEIDVVDAVGALRTKRTALFLGGTALSEEQLALAQRVANATGARLLMETFPAIVDRGAGRVNPERLIYLSEFAIDQLKDIEVLVLIGASEPVGFFAYPEVESRLLAPDASVIALAVPGVDTRAALDAVVDALEAPETAPRNGERTVAPSGPLTTQSFAAAVGATMFEGLIVADESNTSGVHLFGATQFAPHHQWMTLTGGSIGYGLPVALGAAVASGERVLCLESDGSMMYTLQALWTMARESLDVTIVGLSNRSYAILNLERQRVGATREGAASERMLELDDPSLDLCALARGLGVPAVRVESADELVTALRRSYMTPGPAFIEAVLPKGLS